MQPTTVQTSTRLRKVNAPNTTITPSQLNLRSSYILYGGLPRTPPTASPATFTLAGPHNFADALSDLEASPPRLTDPFGFDNHGSPTRRQRPTKPTRLVGTLKLLQFSMHKVLRDKNLTQWTAFLYCAPLIGFLSLLITTILLLRSGPDLVPAFTGTLDLKMAMGSIISAVPAGVLVGSGLQMAVSDTKQQQEPAFPIPVQAAYETDLETDLDLEYEHSLYPELLPMRADDFDVAPSPTTSETHRPEDTSNIASTTLVKLKVILYLIILGLGIILWLLILRVAIWTIAKLANKFAHSELVWENGMLGADEDEFFGSGPVIARPGPVLRFESEPKLVHDGKIGEMDLQKCSSGVGEDLQLLEKDIWEDDFEAWEEGKDSTSAEALSQENLIHGIFA
ncbi:hypothetical protein BDN72DRAFT_902676 [Pluteus cervinus]|uniref:Uncharacterized protein n=1 Tax=Pluteus cervinus TaxID=181527 RepID=A0ACD3AC12_9AGAR|nr:hypothetical protein BDN72DRAFT_902676 [Pluteus cervinus]